MNIPSNNIRSIGVVGLQFIAALLLGAPDRVAAAGYEDTVSGAVSLGRAANALRVSDFMATWQNPANLALMSGPTFGAELRLPVLQSCFDRARDDTAAYRVTDPVRGNAGSESFENVCNEGGPVPTGNIGFAQAFDSGWGWGVGFFTPASNAASRYGRPVIVTQFPLEGETSPITPDGVESPNRFLLLERDIVGGFVLAGAGVQMLRQLRVGLSLGFGFASFHNVNVASVQGGTFRDQEVLNDLNATDWFIPRGTVGLAYAPADAFELMASLTYQSDVHASGSIDLTTNGFRSAPLTDCRVRAPAQPGPRCRSDGTEVTVKFPSLEAVLGLRYAQRRNPRARVLDPMRDEVWDIEVDGYWSQTSHVDQSTIRLFDQAPGEPGSTNLVFSSSPMAQPLAVPALSVLPYNWRDTFGVRVGGDYNVLPAKLAVRVGFSYETRAVSPEYMNIDVWPVAKIGLHVGATVAIDELKLTVGYAHVFFQPVEVGVGAGRVREIVSQNRERAQAVNEGSYRAALDVVSLQTTLEL